eukprot:GEMP01025243.1.p1 GENE.GEMP01025243.1~~GEMP01025243.1.p1  ORF type:complete len:731 (+),score=214.27 GEMP01025243.1:114-2306(+)
MADNECVQYAEAVEPGHVGDMGPLRHPDHGGREKPSKKDKHAAGAGATTDAQTNAFHQFLLGMLPDAVSPPTREASPPPARVAKKKRPDAPRRKAKPSHAATVAAAILKAAEEQERAELEEVQALKELDQKPSSSNAETAAGAARSEMDDFLLSQLMSPSCVPSARSFVNVSRAFKTYNRPLPPSQPLAASQKRRFKSAHEEIELGDPDEDNRWGLPPFAKKTKVEEPQVIHDEPWPDSEMVDTTVERDNAWWGAQEGMEEKGECGEWKDEGAAAGNGEGEAVVDVQREIVIEAEDGDDEEGAKECNWYAAQGQEEKDADEMVAWDETCIVVRQGQLQVDMMDQHPKLSDEQLHTFCDWLSRQLSVVVNNFPYVRRSGATVDLSDNKIGPKGLDRLFTVLRDHRVPCVTIKTYRNLLDDSIVNTLVEYLYTQPEAHPIHGMHMSHNQITNKGAMRLVKAADQCGHYPRKLTRQPLWLRLENNAIVDPEEFVRECQREGVRLCVMKDGMCSSPTCDHLKNIAVQLPHFFNQPRSFVRVQNRPHKGGKMMNRGKGGKKWAERERGEQIAENRGTLVKIWGPTAADNSVDDLDGEPIGAVAPEPPVAYNRNRPNKGNQYNQYNYNKGKGNFNKGKGNYKGNFDRSFQQPVALLGKKKHIDVDLASGELGFDLAHDGGAPRVSSVEHASDVANAGVQAGMHLVRINGIDTTMLAQTQITEMLGKRPITLRMGDP